MIRNPVFKAEVQRTRRPLVEAADALLFHPKIVNEISRSSRMRGRR
jgi:hypothetical protein